MSSKYPYSFSNLARFVGTHFPTLFILALFLLGGFLSGVVYTGNKLTPGAQTISQPMTFPSLTTAELPKLEGLQTFFGSIASKFALPTPPASALPAVSPSPLAPGQNPLSVIPAPSASDHYRGNLNAKVVLIEYADFECPYCAQFEPTMDQLTQAYGDKIGRIYRHFPLSNHPHAETAAEASECVAKQLGNDGFWKFNDAIFVENSRLGGLTDDAITQAASNAGANMTDFQTCLSSGEMAPVVKAQQAPGITAGFSGTPSTVMITQDGQRFLIPGAASYDDVKKFIDGYL